MAQQDVARHCTGDKNANCIRAGKDFHVGWNDSTNNPSPDPTTQVPDKECPFCGSNTTTGG